MAHNVRTPAAGTARVLGNVCVAADTWDIPYSPREIQMRRLLARFDFSPERARAVAELAFATTGRRA
ncbi:hypothetical protein SQ03_16900 [Methylobacterium platani JCM 14648]|uniref:Uncharacterized protein n=2 Tax=Methylobacterium platani TaxID=427683 RepID=A0A179RX88_9HYPH|nr:hypothetical protein SQ03_16900 [Methylobacterium platani JCM 14648]OAS14198.1 hypothetical protein A5481_30420 [Methylobacterium platani]